MSRVKFGAAFKNLVWLTFVSSMIKRSTYLPVFRIKKNPEVTLIQENEPTSISFTHKVEERMTVMTSLGKDRLG